MLTYIKLKIYSFLAMHHFKKSHKKHDKFTKHRRKAELYHNKHGKVFEEFIRSVKKKVDQGGNQ